MKELLPKERCRSCKDYFFPKPNNVWHQEYCGKPDCRQASKVASQSRWLNKKENKNYFQGKPNVRRVQQWRKAHPGYSQRKGPLSKKTLQDLVSAQLPEKQTDRVTLAKRALQDLVSAQDAVLIGVIAQLTGSTLQDDIVSMGSRLRELGNDIIHFKGGNHDAKNSHITS